MAGIQSPFIQNREEILTIAAKHGAYNVRLFGSAVRGEATDSSDIDLLVDFEEGRSLFDLISLKQELEEITRRRYMYMGVDARLVWIIIKNDLPDLERSIRINLEEM